MPTLTDLAVRSAPEGATLWDSTLRGFGVRVGKQARTFIVLIDSGRRHSIGRYPLISLAEARIEAKRLLAEKTLGKTKPRFLAYADARESYLKECQAKNRHSTYAGYRSRLNRVDWGPESAWRLFNAATYALRGRVAENPEATRTIHTILDGICEVA